MERANPDSLQRSIRGIIDRVPGVLYECVVKPDGSWAFSFLGGGTQELFGCSAEALYAQPERLHALIIDQDRDAALAAFTEAHEKQAYLHHDFRISKTTGSLSWVRVQAVASRERGGEIHWHGIFNDVSAEKQAGEAIRAKEKKYRNLINHLSSAVVIHGPDTEIQMTNKEAERLLGVRHDEITGKSAIGGDWSFVREDGSSMPVNEFPVNRVIDSGKPIRNLIAGINRPDASRRAWVLVNAYPEWNESGTLDAVVVTFIDLTERVRLEKRTRKNEHLVRSILDTLPESIVVLDHSGTIISVNAAWRRLAEINAADAETANPIGVNYESVCREIRQSEEQASAMAAWNGISAVLEGDQEQFVTEYCCTTNESERWFRLRVMPLGSAPDRGAVIAHEDITSSKELECSLRSLSATDDLTGLFNRRHFFNELGKELERIKRHALSESALLMVDLDRFKKINDRYGHAAGDHALRHIAELFREAIRRADCVGRIGGEEFAILLSGADSSAATEFAERLRKRVQSSPAFYEGVSIPITISVGVNEIKSETNAVERVLKGADQALYRAKKAGRNRVMAVQN